MWLNTWGDGIVWFWPWVTQERHVGADANTMETTQVSRFALSEHDQNGGIAPCSASQASVVVCLMMGVTLTSM